PSDLEKVDASSVRCFDEAGEAAMVAAIKAAAKEGDSLGGTAEVLAFGVPVGLGSHVHWDRKLDALLAQALMSIQAIKAVEIGEGIDV
ncbi:UNVERIFIED_CONTAM: chorismate synthase, partial [Bacteroidetes bacterium 56_B9]